MILNAEFFSNHGTSQGIWPRFYLQMADLGENAIGKDAFDKKASKYFNSVMPELTNLYDTYHKIQGLINDYKEGVSNGTYFKIDSRGQYNFDRGMENEIQNAIKDFFIRGKITVVNFVKSGIIDDATFALPDFYFCDSKKFEVKKDSYLNSTNGKYSPLLAIIEKGNQTFLSELNYIRGKIEHSEFTIAPFNLESSIHGAEVFEPMLEDKIISVKLEYFYENILDFIEKLIAYYYGINGEINKNGFYQLHIRRGFNYPELKYKYLFALGGLPFAFPTEKCLYD